MPLNCAVSLIAVDSSACNAVSFKRTLNDDVHMILCRNEIVYADYSIQTYVLSQLGDLDDQWRGMMHSTSNSSRLQLTP